MEGHVYASLRKYAHARVSHSSTRTNELMNGDVAVLSRSSPSNSSQSILLNASLGPQTNPSPSSPVASNPSKINPLPLLCSNLSAPYSNNSANVLSPPSFRSFSSKPRITPRSDSCVKPVTLVTLIRLGQQPPCHSVAIFPMLRLSVGVDAHSKALHDPRM
jgi:hypothetical protein